MALTSPTSGGRSVGIIRSRTQATEFSSYNIIFKLGLSDAIKCKMHPISEILKCREKVILQLRKYCKKKILTIFRIIQLTQPTFYRVAVSSFVLRIYNTGCILAKSMVIT
jgi:hypothetical protein